MQKKTFAIFLLLFSYAGFCQQIDLLFKQKNYQKIVERGADWQKLSGQDLFRVAQSHIKLGNDSLAVVFGDHAKNRGYDTWEVDLAQAIAHSNLENYKLAVAALGKGLEKNDQRKILWLELAGNLYKDKQLDSAKATYNEIARLWQGDALSNFMECQILMEIKPSQKCIDCFRKRLYIFPKKGQFYQEALEKIAKMEHFVTLDFDAAEQSYQRLIAEFPDQKDYLVLLLQLYWYQNKALLAEAVETEIVAAWYNQKMSNHHYKRGMLLIDSFSDDIIRVEVYKSPSKNIGEKPRYEVFVLSAALSRPLGKISIFEKDLNVFFQGYGFENGDVVLFNADYPQIKSLIVSGLSFSLEKTTP